MKFVPEGVLFVFSKKKHTKEERESPQIFAYWKKHKAVEQNREIPSSRRKA